MRWVRRLLKPGDKDAAPVSAWGGEHVDVDLYWAQAWADLRIRQGEMARRMKLTDATWRVNQEADRKSTRLNSSHRH